MVSKRQNELKVLNEYWEREGNQLLILYGEEGIGKSTLLNEFTSSLNNVMRFSCSVVSEREQLYFWAQSINHYRPDLPEYPDTEDFFNYLDENSGQNGKFLLIFDEFQNMAKVSDDFVQYLFTFYQTYRNNVMVILCSSTVEWIENSMIKKFGTNARHITGFLKVKDLTFGDFVRDFPQFTLDECIEGYSIFGGVPAIWELLNKKLSLKENIIQIVCNPNKRLYHYGTWVIERSLRETNVYNTILCSMAEGRHKLNDLHLHTGFSRAKISVYIKNLMELGILEKDNSMDTEGRENLLKGIYTIRNRYVYFTYRFLFPNRNLLMQKGADEFYHRVIQPDLHAFSQDVFAQICREYIESENRKGNLPFPVNEVGKWNGKTGSIDILARSDTGKTLIGLCNYEKPMMKYDDYEWLLYCASQAKVSADYVYLISAGGFDEKLHLTQKSRGNVRLLTPDKM